MAITKKEMEAAQGENGKEVNVVLRVSLLLAAIGMAIALLLTFDAFTR